MAYGDASVLGIVPPATVRIDLTGWVHDWPWHMVAVLDSNIFIAAPTPGTPTVIRYPYEHRHEQPDGSWLFVGIEDFTVTAGPPQAPSVN